VNWSVTNWDCPDNTDGAGEGHEPLIDADGAEELDGPAKSIWLNAPWSGAWCSGDQQRTACPSGELRR
jgi:hypothetical protein